jgi:hypothetical protein
MYFTNEIRQVRSSAPIWTWVKDKELALQHLIEAQSAKFEPEKYKDTYRENLAGDDPEQDSGQKVVEAPEPHVAPVIRHHGGAERTLEIKKKPVQAALQKPPAKSRWRPSRKRPRRNAQAANAALARFRSKYARRKRQPDLHIVETIVQAQVSSCRIDRSQSRSRPPLPLPACPEDGVSILFEHRQSSRLAVNLYRIFHPIDFACSAKTVTVPSDRVISSWMEIVSGVATTTCNQLRGARSVRISERSSAKAGERAFVARDSPFTRPRNKSLLSN